ncbi:MAG: BtrH N-terminal domain-containing protein [Clostridium sp.]|jgi:hypothetical protein|nr:BtrH N-terminal domain-containing protein [Clostridium sp.]
MKKIIKEFTPQGGRHCITTSLRQIFDYYGYTLSEAMLFGIGEGLDFTYINLAAAPMVSGRTKIGEFEETLSGRLGITIRVKQAKDYSKVFAKAKQMIDSEHPVLAYVDMPYMEYLGMDKDSHFGGHTVVLFGYDDARQCFHVSERDHSDYPIRTPAGTISKDYHLVPYDQLETARSSNHRPFPANNKYLEFDFSGYAGITPDNLALSIRAVCEKNLNPPTNLKGVNGILKFSKEVVKWNKFDSEKLKRAGVTNYFQINADGGTGGGIFRAMYGEFLVEAATVLQKDGISEIGQSFIALSGKWDVIAQKMWQLHETGDETLLKEMSGNISDNFNTEVDLLTRLQEIV